MIGNPKLLLRCGLLMVSLSLMMALATPAAAQSYVEGVSAILSSTNASEIDTFSETYLTPDIAYYYGAYVEGFLFQNGTQIAFGYADRYPYDNDAYGVLSQPLIVGETYTIESDHYLVAYYIYGYDDYGNPEYWNPESFLIATEGSPEPSGFNFLPGGGPVFYEVEYLYLGTTGVQISAAPPRIDEIGPNAGVLGSSGSMNVHGENLVDIFTGDTMPAITGSGVSVSVNQQNPPDSTLVVLNYTISNSASTGARGLTLATRFGASNAVTFTVGDPTPKITSISPNVWSAGTTTSFTITGTGFGTNPSLKVSGQGVTGSSISSASDTQIQASATIDASSPDGSATVTVTSNGHGGNGFVPTNPGQPSNTSADASIQATEVPQPKILLTRTDIPGATQPIDITGTTRDVVVGQRIVLTGSVQLPAGLSISSQSWSNPPGKTVKSYDASNAGGEKAELTELNIPSLTFYWWDSGNSRQVTYEYIASNGKRNSATATFNVIGPTGDLMIAARTLEDGSGVQVSLGPNGRPRLVKTGVPISLTMKAGIEFKSNATPPSGSGPNQSFIWVQLIDNVQFNKIDASGPFPSQLISGLDNSYPYFSFTPTTAIDTPAAALSPDLGEKWETFTATMYLMWDPALTNDSNGCKPAFTNPATLEPTPSTCMSIPIPLSSVRWRWSGCAINTLSPQTGVKGWIRSEGIPGDQNKCPKEKLDNPKSADFPHWTNRVVNGGN